MGVTAYILVKSNTSEADRVKDEIETLDGVTQANIVAGDVDFIAKVAVETPGAVKRYRRQRHPNDQRCRKHPNLHRDGIAPDQLPPAFSRARSMMLATGSVYS